MNIHYYWEAIVYPATEAPWGAWTDFGEWIRCLPGGRREIAVPAFTVTPRGWYDGKYTKFPWAKKPRFHQIEIVFDYNRCAPRLIIEAGELGTYKDATALVKLPCAGRAAVTFERTSK